VAESWNELTGDLAALTSALAALEGTELEEQVFIATRPEVGAQPDPLLDVAHMEEEPGDGRFQVYVTLPQGTTLDDYDLPWPSGSGIVDDSGDNATLELGPASSHVVARGLADVAATLAPGADALVWSTTLEL
jgi:hypothetical protein